MDTNNNELPCSFGTYLMLHSTIQMELQTKELQSLKDYIKVRMSPSVAISFLKFSIFEKKYIQQFRLKLHYKIESQIRKLRY